MLYPVDAPPPPVVAQAAIEVQFEAALRLIDTGQAAAAVPILERLYTQTKAPRVHLEWARALLFAGRLSESRSLFIAIYKTDPPAAVKATILRFIDQIDHRRGKLSLGVSAIKTSNPLGQPSEVQLYFLGNPFTLQLGSKDRNLWGIVTSAGYERSFETGFDIRANAVFREMPKHSDTSQLVSDVSIGKKLRSGSFDIRVGGQFEQMTNQSYRLPYAELGYRRSINERFEIQPRLQIGYYDFAQGRGLSGINLRLSAPMTYMLTPAKVLAVGPRIEVRDAKLGEQRYLNVGIYAESVLSFKFVTVDTSIYPYTTQFGHTDPFWGDRRADKALYVGTVISSDRIRIKGVLPTLNPFCAFNGSNIAFYRVNNCGFNIGARKIF